MPHSDNVWHKDACENIPPPACLICFKKIKTEKQRCLIEMWLDIQQNSRIR